MFPMGIAGKSTADKLKAENIEIDFFSDNNSKLWGTSYKGKKCISTMDLLNMDQDNLIVIVESLYYTEIKEQLQKLGIKHIIRIYFEKIEAERFVMRCGGELEEKKEQLKALCEDEQSKEIVDYIISSWMLDDISDDYFKPICSKNQYFDDEIVSLGDEEVLVDLGAYIGDTAETFLRESNDGKFEKMHLFELDTEIYKRLLKNIVRLYEDSKGVIQCYPYGIGDEKGSFTYKSGDSNSTIKKQDGIDDIPADAVGEVRTLDDILGGEKVTFIKADIEGAEMNALRGAQKIIREQKPVLAICIYHSPEDMFDIPKYIKELVPKYKIYIRHYTDLMLETVCYAIPD